jgi:hypothetical protein
MREIQRSEVACFRSAWKVTSGIGAGNPERAHAPAADRLPRPVEGGNSLKPKGICSSFAATDLKTFA